MSDKHENTWATYTSSWKAKTSDDKRAIFAQCLDSECVYTDPLARTQSWDEFLTYMQDFHQQIPGGHFVTTYFLAHHDQSIAKWDMKNGEGVKVGEGISYGKYNAQGLLVSMTGFYETP